MGYTLKRRELDDGMFMEEKACENYECRSCGSRMISVNFVTGICIQVFVSHKKDCSLFTGSAFERTKEVTCDTCRYCDEEHVCHYAGGQDSRMADVRTSA